ncbi:hypothetical protein HHI36_019957, partial [Cryptolaemus montrouzieri]
TLEEEEEDIKKTLVKHEDKHKQKEKLSADIKESIKKVTKHKRSKKREEITKVETDESEKEVTTEERKSSDKDKENITITEIEEETELKEIRTRIPEDISFDDEQLNSLSIPKVPTTRVLPLQITNTVSEAITTSRVAQTKEAESISKANIQMIPLSALVKQQVVPVETEQNEEFPEFKTVQAHPTLDSMETYQTIEHISQMVSQQFDATFKPNTSRAKQDIETNESITIEEINIEDVPNILPEDQTTTTCAGITLLEQEAPTVTETQFEVKEKSLDSFSLPKTSKATTDFIVQKSINIEEIVEADTGDTYVPDKSVLIKPKMNVESNEPLIVEEVQSEIKPGKYLPEAFVPTEVASERIIPQKCLTQSEMVASETEGDFASQKLPTSQKADVQFSIEQAIITSESGSHDKEGDLENFKSSSDRATKDFILSESLSVTTADSQIPQTDLVIPSLDAKTAALVISPREIFVTSTNTPVESETQYEATEKPESKMAELNITCLEASTVSIVKTEESEDSFTPESRPTPIIAEKNVNSIETVEISHIQTAEMPEEFKDKIKFKYDTAEQIIDTSEATHVSEIHAEEKETKFDHIQPIISSANTIMNERKNQVEIIESQTMEKEISIRPFEIPDSQKGKSIASHMLPTGITEEVTPDHQVSIFEEKLPISTAEVTQSCLSETIIQETQSSESLGIHNIDDKPISKMAEISVRPVESIYVEEIIPQSKEKEFTEKEKPDMQKASTDMLSQQVASSTLIQLEHSIGELQCVIPETFAADYQADTLKPLEITEHETAEKEANEVILNQVPLKQAYLILDTAKESINVTQVLSQEKELELAEESKPTKLKAASNVASHEATVQFEITETVTHASDIIEEELHTGKAKKITKPFEELIVTETNLVDIEKRLDKDVAPKQKQANIDITPGQELSVTEVITSDKEKNLICNQQQSTTAEVDVEETHVAVNEIKDSEICPGIYERISPEKQLASQQLDLVQHITSLQFTPGEKEGVTKLQETPDKKQVNIEIIEKESIHVSEELTFMKEKSLETSIPIKEVKCETNVTSHPLAITSETCAEESINTYKPSEVTEMKASTLCSTLESIEQTECVVQEKEGNFVRAIPNEKLAELDFQLGESLSITSVIHADKEKDLVEGSVDHFIADTSISPHRVLQIGETVIHDTTSEFKELNPTSASATTINSKLRSLIQEEIIAGETESYLEKMEKPNTKQATIDLEETSLPIISQVQSSEKEGEQISDSKPDTVNAKINIEVQPVAEVGLITSQITTKEIITLKPISNVANIDQLTLDYIVQTQSTVHESEGQFNEKETDLKEANVDIIETSGVIITDITADETEIPLTIIPNEANEKQADLRMNMQDTAINTETNVQESIGPLDIQMPEMKSATSDLTTLSTGLISETISIEMEGKHEIQPLDERTATISIDERSHVIIESQNVNDKESIFEESLKELKLAQSCMNDSSHGVASAYQSQTNESLAPLEDETRVEMFANTSDLPFVVASQRIQTIIDTEQTLPDDQIPLAAIASENIRQTEAIQIEEMIMGSKELEFKPNQLPDGKYAVPNIDIPQKIAEKNVVQTADNTDSFGHTMPSLQKASVNEQSLEGLVITENQIQEKEVSFTGKFAPFTSKAKIAVDNEKQALNVSESLVQYKEEEFEQTLLNDTQQAKFQYDTQSVPEIAQVVPQDNTSDMIIRKPKSEMATPSQTIHTQLTQMETCPGEKEEIFEEKIKLVTKTAVITLEEGRAITTSEVIAEEKQDEVGEKIIPRSVTAQLALSYLTPRETTEVTASQNIEDFTASFDKQVAAVPENEPLHTAGRFETVALEIPNELIDQVPLVSKTAETKLDILSEIQVSQTDSQAPVKHVEEFKKVEEIASPHFDQSRPLHQTEVIANENVCDISLEEQLPKKVNVSQDVLQSITQAVNIVHESESTLESKENISKVAVAEIDEVSSVNVALTIDYEKEKDLANFSIENKHFANISIPLDNMVIPGKSEIQAHDTIRELSEVKPKLEIAETSQDKLKSLIVSENIVQEAETMFETAPIEQKSPHVSLQIGEHITITETISSQKETGLEDNKVEERFAEKALLSQEAMQITQVEIKEGLLPLEMEEINKTYPYQEQIAFKNIVTTEVITNDKEQILLGDTKREYESAKVNVETPNQPLNVFEISPEQTEKDIYEFSPNVKNASVEIGEQISLQQIQTDTYDTLQKYGEKKYEGQLAEITQSDLQGILVSEQTVQENEMPFKQDEVITKNVLLNILPEDHVSISEIVIGQKESEFIEDKITPQKAEKIISPQEVPQISEITSQQSIDNLIIEKPDTTVATKEHIPFSNLSITEVVTHEKEEAELVDAKVELRSAQVILEKPQKSAVTAETIPSQLETPIEEFKPHNVKAALSLIEQDSLQQTKIESYDTTNDLTELKTKSATAVSTQNSLDSLTVTQNLPQERESELTIAETDFKSGQISVLPEEHLIISEVKPSDKEDIFTEEKFNQQLAEKVVLLQEATEIMEIRSEQNIEKLIIAEQDGSKAERIHIPHKNISVLEIITDEKSGSTIETSDAPTQTVNITLEATRPIPITSEVTPQQREKYFDKSESIGATAEINVLEQTGLEESRVEAFDTTKLLTGYEPQKESVLITQGELNSLIVTENRSQDTENILEEDSRLENTATTILLPEQHLTITETISNQRESEFHTTKETAQAAEKVILPYGATEVNETKTEETFSSMRIEKPDMAEAVQKQIQLENVLITEIVANEKEKLHEENVKPTNLERAEMMIQPNVAALNISDVITEEKEEKLTTHVPVQNKAISSFSEKTVITCSETDSLDTLEPYSDQQPLIGQASQQPILAESIVESQINVQGITAKLKTQKPTTAEGNLDFVEQKSLTVTEVTSEGQVAEKVLEVNAKHTISVKETEKLPVVVTEENTSLLGHETFKPEKMKSNKAHVSIPDEHYGLIVTEQNSADNLKDLTKDKNKLEGKTVSISYGEKSSSILVTEVLAQESEDQKEPVIAEESYEPEKMTSTVLKEIITEEDKPVEIENEKQKTKKKIKKSKIEKLVAETEEGPILFVPTLANKEEPSNTNEVVKLIEVEILKKALSHNLPEVIQNEEINEIIITQIDAESPKEILPEEIETAKAGRKHKKITKKITKNLDDKQEKTTVITVQEEGKEPETSVVIDEIDTPKIVEEITRDKIENEISEEFPEVVETIDKQLIKHKKIIKRKVITKPVKGEKPDISEEEYKQPQTSVIIEEIESSEIPEETPEKGTTSEVIEEFPEIIETVDHKGIKHKKIMKKKIITKLGGEQQESITTFEVEGEHPETTVEIEEIETSAISEETPQAILISEEVGEVPELAELTDKKVIKSKKVTKKRVISKQDIQPAEIVTPEETDSPQTGIIIEEIDFKHETAVIEDIPDIIEKDIHKKTTKKKAHKKINESEELKEEEPQTVPIDKVQEEYKTSKTRMKPIKMTIEMKKVEPKKMEVPIISEQHGVKLKPTSRKLREEKPKPKFPKFMLKSRIKLIEFPSLKEKLQPLLIRVIQPVVKDKGILSRNINEAEKVPKTKPRKLKNVDNQLKKLEGLDMEFEELKKTELETVDDEYREPAPRKKSIPNEEPSKLKIGKGEKPGIEDDTEKIQLKKRPDDIEKDKLYSILEDDLTPSYIKAIELTQVQPKSDKKEELHFTAEDRDETTVHERIKERSSTSEEISGVGNEQIIPGLPQPREKDDLIPKNQKPEEKLTHDQPLEIIKKGKLKKKSMEETPQPLKPIRQDESPEFVQTIEEIKIEILVETAKEIIIPEEEKEEISSIPKKPKKLVKKKTTPKVTPDEPEEQIEPKAEKTAITEPTEKSPLAVTDGEASILEAEEVDTVYEPKETIEDLPIEEIGEEADEKLQRKKIVKAKKKSSTKESKVTEPQHEQEKPDETVVAEIGEKVIKKKPKLQKEKSVIIEMKSKPQYVKISKPQDEPVNFAEIKLKKPRQAERKPVESSKLPKFLLKSRIKFITFPPISETEQLPIITQLKPVFRDNGILSRNMADAAKIKKKKPIKMKDIESEITELEKLDQQFEELKKPELEAVDEAFKFKKKPKVKDEIEEGIRGIEIGKGKKPKPEEQNESIKLKKTPLTVKEEEIEIRLKLAKEIDVSIEPEIKEKSQKENIEPFKGSDIDRDDIDLETREPFENIEKEPKLLPQEKPKYDRKKKEKPKVETIETILKKGVPKIPDDDIPENINLKYKQKPKPEEQLDDVTLKPFKKDESNDKESKEDLTIPIPHSTEEVEELDTVKKPKDKIKKTKVKQKPSTENREVEQDLQELPVKEEKPEDNVEISTSIAEKPQQNLSEIFTPEKIQELQELPIQKEKPEEEELSTSIAEKPQQKVSEVFTPEKILVEEDEKQKQDLKLDEPEVNEVVPEPEKLPKRKDSLKKVSKISSSRKPKIPLLKSRILHNEFPPLSQREQKPSIKVLSPVSKNNGILSRTMNEAVKIIKKKKKPITEDKIAELEKLDEEMVKLKEKKLDEVDEEYRKKPEKPKKLKKDLPKPMRIEWKSVLPTKLKISDVAVEPINLADITLKKTTISEPKKVEPARAPKVLLKSRITYIDFPPLSEIEKKPTISVLTPVRVQNGTFSHNVEEAIKMIKIKKRKLKDEKQPEINLEQLDLEMEELKKKELEKVPEEYHTYKREPKQKPIEQEETPVTLKLGKGKIPDRTEDTEEVVTLKKITKKTEEYPITEETIPKPKKTEDVTISQKVPESQQKLAPIDKFESERTEPDLEEYKPSEPESPEEKKLPEEKPKYKRKPKEKSSPETIQIPLEKGVPKQPETEQDDDVKFRIPSKKGPEEEPTEITLKPHKKSEDDTKESFDIQEIEKPQDTKTDDIKTQSTIDTSLVTIKKKKKPKNTIEEAPETHEDEVEFKLKRPKPQQQEETEGEITLGKPSEKIEDVQEELSLKKPIPRPEEQTEETAELIIKMETPKKDLFDDEKTVKVDETVTLKKKPSKETETPEEEVAGVTIKKKPSIQEDQTTEEYIIPKKKQIQETDEVETQFVVKKPKNKEEAEIIQQDTSIKITKKIKKKPKTIDEAPAELTIKKLPSEESEEIIEIEEKEFSPEKQEDETVSKKPESTEIIETLTMTEIKRTKKPKKLPKEEADVTVQKPEVEDTEISEHETIIVKKKPKEESEIPEEEITGVTIKKKPSIQEDQTTEEYIIPKKKQLQETEEVETQFVVKKPKNKEEAEIIQQDTSIKITKKIKKKPKTIDEAPAELTIKKLPSEESEEIIEIEEKEFSPEKQEDEIVSKKPESTEIIETLTTTEIKRTKKPKKLPKEEADVTVQKPEVEDTEISEHETIIVKKKPKEESEIPEEEITGVTIKKKPSMQEDQTTEEYIIPKKKQLQETDEVETQFVVKKPKNKEEAEIIQQDTSIKITKKIKKKPKTIDEAPAELTIKKLPSEESEEIIEIEEKEFSPEKQEDEIVSKKPESTEITETSITTEIKKTKKPKKYSNEEVDVSVQKPEDKDTETSEHQTINIKKIPKKEYEKPEEEIAGATIKKKPSIQEDQTTEEYIIPKKKQLQETDEVESQFVVKKPKNKEEAEIIQQDTSIKITKKTKKKPKTFDEAPAELSIKKLPSEESEEIIEIKERESSPEKSEDEIISQKPEGTEITETSLTTQIKMIKKPKKSPKEEVDIPEQKSEIEDTKASKPEEDTSEVKPPEKNLEELAQFTIRKPKRDDDDEEETEITLPTRKLAESEEVHEFTIKKKPARKPSIEEHSEEITIKKLKKIRKPSKPDIPEFTDVTDVTFRPRMTKTKEDVDQEFKISLDSYAEEEISMSGKVRLKKKRPSTYSEEVNQETIRIFKEVEDEGPTIEEIIDEGSDAEELPYDEDSPENFHVPLKKKIPRKYSVFEEDEESVSIGLKKKPERTNYEGESITLKPKKKPKSTYDQEAASLSITRKTEIEVEDQEVEIIEGDIVYCIRPYNAEAESAIDLVEGERLYIIETHDSDWWFVKKHITNEKGWVPAHLLMDESNYTIYVQKKLNEKIDKLPVFEQPSGQQKSVAPKFIEKLKPTVARDGDTVQFQCQVEGVPRPQITWFRQTAIIKHSEDFQIYYDEDNVATLIIKEVFSEDTGSFTCVAKNSSGFASTTTELIVEHPTSDHVSDYSYVSRKSMSKESSLADVLEGIPPTFFHKPNAHCVPVDSDIEIECGLMALPEPHIIWYRKGRILNSDDNITIKTTSKGHKFSTTLKIKNIQKVQEGDYEIVARNREGESRVHFTINVISDVEQAPKIIEPLHSVTVRRKETVILKTVITSNPPPTIEWFRNGEPLEPSVTEVDGHTYTYKIDRATPNDAAEYTVTATNPRGIAETSAYLTVE